MGNETSSPRHRRDRYEDDETTIDGTSILSENTRDTGFSAVSRDTGLSSRYDNYRSSSKSLDSAAGGNPFNVVLNNNLIDTICGRPFFEDEDDDDDDNYSGRNGGSSSRRRKSKKKSSSSSAKDRKKSASRSGSRSRSYDSDADGSYDSDDNSNGRTSKSKKYNKHAISDSMDDFPSEKVNTDSKDSTISYESNSKESMSQSKSGSKEKASSNSFESIGSNSIGATTAKATTLTKPLASSFAKRCYFTKAGIGKNMQHYEGITLNGNTILMLASSMKLKGCPTICDEDLRRVEQTYPNQFGRLPDELLLSSGWRRISKYCHFSGKAIPDGLPFFHSKERCHPNGGYYFLLAASIGMERPSDVEPLTLDMLILLQTDYPIQCDQTPHNLIEDPQQWILVTKFCFFSGGPINTDEDVYYRTNFNGGDIYMLAFLSPNMTPEELYRLNDITGENALKSVAAVEEIETVYDLTQRDFDDLKLYHLGPCRALPDDLLKPQAWEKILPQHFLECRENALARAYEYEIHAQEAVAKANKMMGLGFAHSQPSHENGHATIERNQQSQDPPAGVAPYHETRHYHSESGTNSYREMPQMRDSHDQYSGSSYQGTNSDDGAYDHMTMDETKVYRSSRSTSSNESNIRSQETQKRSRSDDLAEHQRQLSSPRQAEDTIVADVETGFDDNPTLADPPDNNEGEGPISTIIEDHDNMLTDFDDNHEGKKDDIDGVDDSNAAMIPTGIDSTDRRALDDYYRGIEKRELKDEHPDDEFPSHPEHDLSQDSSDNHNSHTDAFEKDGKKRSSLDDVTLASTLQSQRDDDEYDGLPSTPQQSEYISMQELNPASPDRSYGMEVDSQNKNNTKSKQDKYSVDDEPTLANFAGYGYARQISSAVGKASDTSPSSQIFLTPRKETTVNDVGDEPTNTETHDENSPPISVKPIIASFEEDKHADRTNLTSLMSVGSKSAQSRDTLYSRGTSSTAMRGARELLKKNREERLALMAKRKAVKTPVKESDDSSTPLDEIKEEKQVKTVYSHRHSRSVTPNKKRFQGASLSSPKSPVKKPQSPAPSSPSFVLPKTPPSSAPNALNKSMDFSSPTSDISGSSSGWAEDDKDSRRALILKMAKHRMRHKKEVRAS